MKFLWVVLSLVVISVTCFNLDSALEDDVLDSPAIKCFVSGLPKNADTNRVLSFLFSGVLKYENNANILYSLISDIPETTSDTENATSTSPKYVLASNHYNKDIYSDMAIVFIKPSELYNEDALMATIQTSLKSVLKSEAKKSLILLTLTNSKKIHTRVAELLNEAYYLLDKEEYRIEEIAKELDIKLIMLKTSDVNNVDESSVVAVRNAIRKFDINAARPVKSLLEANAVTSSSSSSDTTESSNIAAAAAALSMIAPSSATGLIGYEHLEVAVDETVGWSRVILNQSLVSLQKPESAEDFPQFIDDLIDGALKLFRNTIYSHGVLYNVSSALTSIQSQAVTYHEKEIIRNILKMTLPLYRVQLQLAQNTVINEFNQAVTEDDTIQNSIEIEKKLNTIISKHCQSFAYQARKLIPKYARKEVNWNAYFQQRMLQETLVDYKDKQLNAARVKGILPRYHRRPIAVSFHTIASHPFGIRDYRQDVLGDETRQNGRGSGDQFLYEPEISLNKINKQLVDPAIARRILKQTQELNKKNKYNRDIARKSEYAREMLMFPLSVKNPSVPLMVGRSKKRTGPPKFDTKRVKTGPERFIRWDVSPMDKAKAALQRASSEATRSVNKDKNLLESLSEGVEKVVNYIPWLGTGNYEHPPINYGPQYGAYLPTSERGKAKVGSGSTKI